MITALGFSAENRSIRRRKLHLVSVLSMIIMGVLLLVSCLSRKIYDSSDGLVVNPYNFSQLDIEGAKFAIASAEADSTLLANLLKFKRNPYKFSEADIEWANVQLQQANQNRVELQQMLNSGDYTFVGRYIQNQSQIDSGKIYWSSQKQEVESSLYPYWETQKQIAISENDSTWVDFCNDMIAVLDRRVVMIDALLQGLHADDSLINEISSEEIEHVVNRKIAVETLVAEYYDQLTFLLYRAIDLEAIDWSGLKKIIPDSAQIEQGKIYWSQAIDSTTNVLIPFWRGELEASKAAGNTQWVEFTELVLMNLGNYVTLATKTLEDLTLDSIIVKGASSERSRDICERKSQLNKLKLNYYRDLIYVLDQGINLVILKHSI